MGVLRWLLRRFLASVGRRHGIDPASRWPALTAIGRRGKR